MGSHAVGGAEPATFVWHYEDAARIIAATAQLPALNEYADLQSLAAEMLAKKQIAVLPSTSIPALAPDEGPLWNSLRRAHAAIDPMFWGPSVSPEDACTTITTWAKTVFKSDFFDFSWPRASSPLPGAAPGQPVLVKGP